MPKFVLRNLFHIFIETSALVIKEGVARAGRLV